MSKTFIPLDPNSIYFRCIINKFDLLDLTDSDLIGVKLFAEINKLENEMQKHSLSQNIDRISRLNFRSGLMWKSLKHCFFCSF